MSADDEKRASRPGVAPALPNLTPEQEALREAENGLRQFDRLITLIESAVAPGAPRFRLRPSTLMDLNRIAVEGLQPGPGSYRHGPIEITFTSHQPPPAEDVPGEVDGMCEYVLDHWDASPVHLSSYIMWRLNWIHPFNDGNGRTSRAVSYLVLCARLGLRLPGTQTIPERIAANKSPYYTALDQADAAWRQGTVDVSAMEDLVAASLAAQLVAIHQLATGETPATMTTPRPATMTTAEGQTCHLCGHLHPYQEMLPGHPAIPKIPDSLEVDSKHAKYQPANIIRCANHTECLARQMGPDGKLRTDVPNP